MSRTEALVRAQKKYADSTHQFRLSLRIGADDDVIQALREAEPSASEYIRQLVRADISRKIVENGGKPHE